LGALAWIGRMSAGNETTTSLLCSACGALSSEFNVRCSTCGAPLSPPVMGRAQASFLDRPVGARALGQYRLRRPLGRGGVASRWLAEEAYEGRKLRDVALKLFFAPEERDAAARWREDVVREAGALCRVEHPNVVRFHSLQREDALGVIGLAMEYVA